MTRYRNIIIRFVETKTIVYIVSRSIFCTFLSENLATYNRFDISYERSCGTKIALSPPSYLSIDCKLLEKLLCGDELSISNM